MNLHLTPTDLPASRVNRRQRREHERSGDPLKAGRPANSIQAGCGYKDHVVKPAEVRRNDAVGPAATIPY